jgi:membrane-associated phospholipid phosphatase
MQFCILRALIASIWLIASIIPVSAATQNVSALSSAQTTPAPTMNLAFLLPKAQIQAAQSQGSTLSNSSRIGYDAAIVGTGLLIASNDRGLYRTIQGPNGPSKSEAKAANDVTHLGDLTYVAPTLGLVYLIGGKTNHDIAWKSSIAVLKAGAIGLLLKEAVGRERPGSANPGSAGVFHLGGGSSDNFQSFPSGHTLVAFSVASVWAGEKPHDRYLAYGLASAVGLSRIIGQDHWPSDVFFGALLGFTQGRQALHGNTNLLDFRF